MDGDVLIEVRFKRLTSEGGRKGAIVGDRYGCPLFVDGEGFDCRIDTGGQSLILGETYVLAVKFMNPHLALPTVAIDKPITLWEGKEIAAGKIVQLCGVSCGSRPTPA